MSALLFALALLPTTTKPLPALSVTAASAIIMDAESGKVLWEKDADTPRPPASTTKVMTGLLLLEHTKPDDEIVAPDDIESVGEASMHLVPGEHIKAKDMLYALMLRSANDGCYAVAKHISGSVQAFAQLMNDRAKELGCPNPRFANPNGLPNPNHKISARGLALIAREAMKRPEFREVVRTWKTQIERSDNQEDRWMINKNKYLKIDPTADGIKTGWTLAAGHCYVGSATRDGFRVITVVLKSEDWVKDHSAMLDWAFKNFQSVEAIRKGSFFTAVGVENGVAETLMSTPATSMHIAVRKTNARMPIHVEPLLPVPLKAPVAVGAPAGKLKITDPDGFTIQIPMIASEAVAVKPFVQKAASSFSSVVILFGFIGGAYLLRRRVRLS